MSVSKNLREAPGKGGETPSRKIAKNVKNLLRGKPQVLVIRT
jgi:hypothetical protein